MVGPIAALLVSLVALDAFVDPTGSKSAPGGAAERDIPRSEVRLTAPDRRLRATDPRVQALIANGARRSHTFAMLLSELDRTDVIVYAEVIRNLPATMAGRLLLVPVAGDQRYLRIQIGTGGTADDFISTLAHELQHAIEIGTSREVRDQDSLAKFYQRIGQLSVGAHAYDTLAARTAGRRVKHELGG